MVGTLAYNRHTKAMSKTIENLSTGIKIQSGRDDPSGYISSRVLETELSSTKQAIANCQRSNQLLSVVDSALAEVNKLMIDLRTYVTEAANTGTESAAMIESLQLQVDATLSAIDRIANTTSFQGQKLLDGSLDFTTYGLDRTKASQVEIHAANFNGATEKDVSFKVMEVASQGVLYYQYGVAMDALSLQVSGKDGSHVFTFDAGADIVHIADAINLFSDATGVAAKVSSEATHGMIGLSSVGQDNDFILTASKAGTEEGNYVIKFVAPEEGNDQLSMNVTPGSGLEPNEIEVVLRTEQASAPVYKYEGENDGISHNEFQIVGKTAGTLLNDIEFEYVNVYGTGEEAGLQYDFKSSPKTVQIALNYNELDPNDPENTTVNDLRAWLESDPVLNAYLAIEDLNYSDGTGTISPEREITLEKPGVEGGKVLTTAAELVTFINNSPELKDTNGDGLVHATLPTGSIGAGTVSPFSEYAYYGDVASQNAIQFLAPSGAPNIQFVSVPGEQLSIDDTTIPAVYGKASALVQGFGPGTSFTLQALSPGDEYDGMSVIFRDSPDESAVLDPSQNAVIISVDFTGRNQDPDRAAFNMADLQQLIARDPFLGDAFQVLPLGSYDPNDPPEFSSEDYLNIDAKLGTINGGLVQQATLVVHLETDSTGAIRTTANDLVEFFDNPYYPEAQEILSKYGISASIMDLPNAAQSACYLDPSLNGFGLLQPTIDLDSCNGDQVGGEYSEIVFTSYGLDKRDDHANTEVVSQNGMNSGFTVHAKKTGAEYNNTTVRIYEDVNGPNITYDSQSKQIRIGIDPNNPPSANDVIELINSDPATKDLFQAGRLAQSTGEGSVAVNDFGTLSGGVQYIGDFAETTTVAQNGVDAVFSVKAKKLDAGMDGITVRTVSDPEGPRVIYDPASKEISIGLDPQNPMTAAQIVDLINGDPEINRLFEAEIPSSISGTLIVPDGSGIVSIGDYGVLSIPEEGTPRGAPMTNNSDSEHTGLAIYAVDYGSDSFVSIISLFNSGFPTVDQFGNSKERQYGTDVTVMINDEICKGKGNVASVHTSDLDLSVTISPSAKAGDVFGMRITGGGALMQLGPDATSSQQARIGLIDLHVAKLGGISGWLSEIGSGGSLDMATDPKGAFRVIEEVTEQITALRGRIGSFQKTQLDVNTDQLLDMFEIGSGALSSIRDTDFADETAKLSRLEVLMQSSISVLQRSGQSERLWLSLLQQ